MAGSVRHCLKHHKICQKCFGIRIAIPFPYPSVFNVLADSVVNALQLGLGQRRPDVRHLVQTEVQRLHTVALPSVPAHRDARLDLLGTKYKSGMTIYEIQFQNGYKKT